MNFKEMLSSFMPGFDPTPLAEKFRSAAAVMAGILLLGWIVHLLFPDTGYFGPSMLSSMAAAALLVYAVPHSPMAQPWPLVVGNLVSAVVGVTCAILIPGTLWAAAGAAGLAVLAMHLTRSLHPPGAATALFMVLNEPVFQQHGWLWSGGVVLANVMLTLMLALVINNLIHLGRYPVRRHHAPVTPAAGPTLTESDVEWAMRQMEGVTDVSEEDLLEIFRLACLHAQKKN
ncbi:MAG TPA: HPP family protein [Gallionellaceae bacterium]